MKHETKAQKTVAETIRLDRAYHRWSWRRNAQGSWFASQSFQKARVTIAYGLADGNEEEVAFKGREVWHSLERPIGSKQEAWFPTRWSKYRTGENKRGSLNDHLMSWDGTYRLAALLELAAARCSAVRAFRSTGLEAELDAAPLRAVHVLLSLCHSCFLCLPCRN